METQVKGIILAGVHRWRNSLLEQTAPRAMLPVVNRPLVEHVIAWLREGGVSDVTICANSDTRTIRDRLGAERHRCRIRYYEDELPRGPAGCVRDASIDGAFDAILVTDAAMLPYPIDLRDIVCAHLRSDAGLTVAVASDSPNHEGAAPLGVYVVAPRALQLVPPIGYQDIKEALVSRLHASGERVTTYAVKPACPRVTCADTYLAVNAWLLENCDHRPQMDQDYDASGGIWVHRSAKVHQRARVVGPACVGPECVIEDAAMIIGPACLGRGCAVLPGSIVSRSILWDEAGVAPDAVVDRCIMMNGSWADANSHQYNRVLQPQEARRRALGSFRIMARHEARPA